MKTLLILVVMVLVALGVWWYVSKPASPAESPAEVSSVETTEDVDKTLNSLDSADLEKEFKDVDTAANSL